MEKETIIKYTPLALVIATIFFQWNLFVTPSQLEQKNREILKEVSLTYVPKEQYNMQYDELKAQITHMQDKIDKIYEIVTRK